MSCIFKRGDLVSFDYLHSFGVVIEAKPIKDFHYAGVQEGEEVYDVLVQWSDGAIFWCLEFTLQHVL